MDERVMTATEVDEAVSAMYAMGNEKFFAMCQELIDAYLERGALASLAEFKRATDSAGEAK
jgi:hypothetical protein